VKFDMASWDRGMAIFLARLDAGAWRHGIKTYDVVKEVAKEGKVPLTLDVEELFATAPLWVKKKLLKLFTEDGDLRPYGLYYYAQSTLKNSYTVMVGDMTGDGYRVRRFSCVPHGFVKGEKDQNGKRRKPPREKLWLRFLDLNPTDVEFLATEYHAREEDSAPNKKLIWNAADVSRGMPDTVRMEDLLDEILGRL